MILWLQALVDPVPDDLVTKPILGKSGTKRIKKRKYQRRMFGSWSNGDPWRRPLQEQSCPASILSTSANPLYICWISLGCFFVVEKIGLHIAQCTLRRGPLVPFSWRMLRTWMLQNSIILSDILGTNRQLVSCTRTIFLSIVVRRWGQPTWLFHSIPPASVNNCPLWQTFQM